jgi:hypothetical protein
MTHPRRLTTVDSGHTSATDPARGSDEPRADRASVNGTHASRRLLETPYSTIYQDTERRLTRFVRTALPYATVEDITLEGIVVQRALDKAGRARLLVDLRVVAARDDPVFEAAIARFRAKLLHGGARTAILVRTAMGALQVKRHLREDGLRVEVFDQEEDALAFFDLVPRAPSQDRGPFLLR